MSSGSNPHPGANYPGTSTYFHNRWFAAVAGGGLLTVGAVVVGPTLAIGIWNLIGFSSPGPANGVGNGIQSAGYGGAVASGPIFALCQSGFMGHIVVRSAAEIAAGVAALGAGAGLIGGLGGSDNNDDAGPDEAGSDNGHAS